MAYVTFVLSLLPETVQLNDAVIQEARALLERSIAAVGLDYFRGDDVWKQYRNFELQLANGDGRTDDEVQQQIERVRRLMQRQLRLPLLGTFPIS